jgi:hypothetical protein
MCQTAFQQPVELLSGLFTATICYHALIRMSGFYRGYKNSSVGLGVAHLLICYCRAQVLLHLCFLHCQRLLLFSPIASLVIEGQGSLQFTW